MIQTTKNTQTIYNRRLSIQFGLNGLSFCVLNTTANTVVALEHLPFNKKLNPFEALERLMHFFEVKEYLKTKFDSILVIHENNLSTLVPNLLFNESYLADYLKFNCKILQSDYLSYDRLLQTEASNVYVPYVNVNNYIYEVFGTFTFKHYSTVLVDTVLQKAHTDANALYIHVNDKHFEIIAVKSKTLQFYNTFAYKDIQDFIYYVLFTIEQLQLDPEEIPVTLVGQVSKDSSFYDILYQYIRHVKIASSQNPYQITNDSSESLSNFIILNSF